MLQGLQDILDKEPVLSTVNALDLQNDAQRVESTYHKHVKTFISMGDMNAFSTRLTRRVIEAKTPKGVIVAPYGYGKTSTLVFLWHECEQQGLVAIPPFYCASLLDILKATYGWVKFRLQHRQPDLVTDLDEIYQKYTAATVEEMALRYAKEHGLAQVTAKNMLNNMLAEGSLVLELTPQNLLFFLDATAALVIRAGFRGLIVFPDEFQQYFSKGANLRRTVQEFREFIWSLDTRANSLGVIFSIPTYAESIIQEQGKDILHRLKKDDLYYRLQDIYTIDFPTRLWERFELGREADKVIDRYTLQSIGQLAEREDLGEGPRTVIDSFKRAILCFQEHKRSYTPIDLIDDFLESNIRFQAQTNKIKTVTRQALDSAVVDTPEKKQAIKLMAAFPRGCPVAVQKEYKLYDVVNALSKHLHAESMILRAEGYTLLGLSSTEGPTRTVDIILDRFWRSYEEDELHLEAAIRAFINKLLPQFFQQRRGTATTGWGNLDFTSSVSGSYVALVEGTFNPQYPRRFVALQIAYKDTQFQPPLSEADFQFDFLFDLNGYEESGNLVLVSERWARFHLNLRQKLGPSLPDDIRKLQDFVNPEFVTPLLMLSLVDYFGRWEEIAEQLIPEGDQAEIDYLIGRLMGQTIQILFNQTVAQSITPSLRRVGRTMLEELFNRLCNKLYPNYHTLIFHTRYEAVVNTYIDAMLNMTLKERRGHSPLRSTKESLARRFGLTSVSSFENRIESEYADLMEKSEWSGRGDQAVAEISLKIHPLEQQILESLRKSLHHRKIDNRQVPILDANEVAQIGQQLGYRDEEILIVLQLLAARGYARFDAQDKIIYLAQTGPDLADLKTQWERLNVDLERVPPELLSSEKIGDFQGNLSEIKTALDQVPEDEEELDDLQTRLNDLSQKLSELLSQQRNTLQNQLNALTLEVERSLVTLRQGGTLDREIHGQVAFVMHLNELRQRLIRERRQLGDEYTALKNTLTGVTDQMGGGPISDALVLYEARRGGEKQHEALVNRREIFETQIKHLEQWIKLLQDTDRLFNTLAQLPDLREQLTQQVVPEIQAHLAKRRLDGLSDWEPLQSKVKAIEQELEKRRRYGNERFTEIKESYEKFLRELRIGDYRPRTRYTYGEDKESYQDLYEEVATKIKSQLDEITLDLRHNQTDLLKARYIHLVDEDGQKLIRQADKQLTEAEMILKQLSQALTISLIQHTGDELDIFGEQVKKIAQSVADTRQQLRPVFVGEHKLTLEEVKVLEAFGSQSDVDLTDLFVGLRETGQEIELKGLLATLEGLYRKNRIIIRVRQRG